MSIRVSIVAVPSASTTGIRRLHEFLVHDVAAPVTAEVTPSLSLSNVRVSLFVAAMGLRAVPISPSSCKGVTSVVMQIPKSLGGFDSTTINITATGWQQSWVTAGDAFRVFDPLTSPDALPWQPVTSAWPPAYASSIWFRSDIPTPLINATTASLPCGGNNSSSIQCAGVPAPQVSIALSLSGMSKGVAYVNGWHLGVSLQWTSVSFYREFFHGVPIHYVVAL